MRVIVLKSRCTKSIITFWLPANLWYILETCERDLPAKWKTPHSAYLLLHKQSRHHDALPRHHTVNPAARNNTATSIVTDRPRQSCHFHQYNSCSTTRYYITTSNQHTTAHTANGTIAYIVNSAEQLINTDISARTSLPTMTQSCHWWNSTQWRWRLDTLHTNYVALCTINNERIFVKL